MDIRVSGHQIDTGEALQSHAEERLGAMLDKYFSRAISTHVTFGQGPYTHSFTCDVIAHVPNGIVLKASGQGGDARAAFDQSATRIEKQLRRYSKRIKDRSDAAAAAAAAQQAIDAGYTIFAEAPEEEEPADNPPIVAETTVDVPEASVADAVMILDLRHTNALLFRNSGTGGLNMVYRRGDGTIGWVEPKRA